VEKHFLVAAVILTGATLISGCQTTGGLQTPEAKQIANILSKSCIIVRQRGSAQIKKDTSDVWINSIQYGPNYWIKASYTARGYTDNFYINEKTGDRACGSKSFSENGIEITNWSNQKQASNKR